MIDSETKFTPKKRDLLRKIYNQAVKKNKETFIFEGKVILTSYAKYLLEHLDNHFNQFKFKESNVRTADYSQKN